MTPKETNPMRRMLLISVLLVLCAPAALAEEVDNPYGEEGLFERPRAGEKHDRVLIVINDTNRASVEATSETERTSSLKWTLSKLFRIGKDRDGDIIAKSFADARKPELDIETERVHEGEGKSESTITTRTELSGSVVEVMPNGHLVVEARKTLVNNTGEHMVIFTGRIDPRDLDADNSVDAKYVMERTVKIKSTGDIEDALRRGWLARAYDFLNPL